LEVWNTETGAWDDPFHTTANSGFRNEGTYVLPWRKAGRFYSSARQDLQELIWNYVTCRGFGLTRYFYYDTRIWHSLIPGTAPTLREYDDSVKPKGVALSCAMAMLYDTSTPIVLTLTDDIDGYVFSAPNGDGLGVIFKRLPPFKKITVGASVDAYDEFGNSTGPENVIPAGNVPVYVRYAAGREALRTLLEAGTVSSLADATAPVPSVEDWASAAGSQGTLWFRSLALDQVSLPSDGYPDDILYSYKLAGVDEDWTDWTAETFVDYGELPSGVYSFSVRAKDAAGNVSSTVTQDVTLDGFSMVRVGNLKTLTFL
jgi:hypothetical protein